MASFWELIRKYFFSTSWFKDLVFNYVSKLAMNSIGGGFIGFIAGIFLKKLLSWGWGAIEDLVIAEQVESKNESKLEDYNEIIQNPDSSAEDIRDAAPDFLGGDIK